MDEEKKMSQSFQDAWEQDAKRRWEAIETLEGLSGFCFGTMSSRRPLFLDWDQVPELLRKKLSYLRADDTFALRTDYVTKFIPPKEDWWELARRWSGKC